MFSGFFTPTSGFALMKAMGCALTELLGDPSRITGFPTNRLRVAGSNAYLNEML
jgi:hypothetical protein